MQQKTFKDSKGEVFFKCELLDGFIKTTWFGDMKEVEAAKEAAMCVVDFLQTGVSHKVLDDNRLGIGQWPDIQQWLAQVWIPAMIKAGLTAYAHVLSPDILAKMPATTIFNQAIHRVNFVTFDSYTSASEWLRIS